MDALRDGKYFKYVEKAPIWLGISCVAIITGIIFMYMNYASTGSLFNLSIHYTGGEKLILRFSEDLQLDGQPVKAIVEEFATGEPIVQVYADDPQVVSIKLGVAASGETEDEISRNRQRTLVEMKEDLGNAFGGYSSDENSPNPETLEQAHVGPTVGRELILNAILALIFGCVLIMLYIWMRFNRWQMSLAAIGALIHDVMITLGVTAALGLEVSDSFIAVILTIIGYSINDTIIIFDRIRENLRNYGDSYPLAQISNLSLSQTLVRSLNTVITVIIMIVGLMIFGGHNLRDFLTAMLVGMISGGYSSIFIATPLMLWITGGKLKEAPAPAAVDSGLPPSIESEGTGQTEAQVTRAITDAVKDKKAKKAAKKQRRR
jgi:preprotein translocase subunit SecF